MPPRKRTAASAAVATDPLSKRTRRGSATLKSDGAEPRAEEEQSKAQNEKNVKALVKKLCPKSRKNELTNVQLSLLISATEGDLLLGQDGKSHIQQIQKDAGCVIVVSDKVEASVDRDVVITGTVSDVVRGCALVAYFLGSLLENCSVESSYRVTLIAPDYKLAGFQPAAQDAIVDISSEFMPLSNFRSVFIEGRLPALVNIVRLLSVHMEDIPQSTLEITPERIPAIGTYNNDLIRSETNEKLLTQSKDLFVKYINKDYAQLLSNEEDPKDHSQSTIADAQRECQKNIKVLEPLKQVIDIPLEFISAVIGRGGTKINEIRSKSNSNVVVGDTVKDGKYRAVTLTGLPEGNLTALRYLQGLVQ